MIKKLSAMFMTLILCTSVVSAASINSLSRGPLTIRNESSLAFCELQIVPLNEVETGSSIFISFTNATVFTQDVIDGTCTDDKEYGYNHIGYQWGWDRTKTFYDIMPYVNTAQLPYYIRKLNDHEIEVYLINVPDIYVNNSLSSVNGIGRSPYFSIPIVAYADGYGDIRMTIDSNGTSISENITGNFDIYDENKTDSSVSTAAAADTAAETTTETATTDDNSDNNSNNNSDNRNEKLTVSIEIGADHIFVNNVRTDIDVPAYIQKNTNSTLVPLRAISEAFGGEGSVEWIAETKTAVIKYNGNEVKFIANSDNMLVNNIEKPIANNAKAEITNERMFVPFRALGEAMGLNVDWEANTKTAAFYN